MKKPSRHRWLGLAAIGCVTLVAATTAWALLEASRRGTLGPLVTEAIVILAGCAALAVILPVRSREMSRQHAVIAAQEDRFQSLVEQSPVIFYIDRLDEGASTVYISPQIERLTGYAAEQWRSDEDLWSKVLHPDDRERALELNRKHIETGEQFLMEYRLLAPDGRTVWIRDEAVVVKNPDGSFRHSQGIMQDITAEREAEERIEYLAYHDGLTGLPNLAMFTQLGELAMARAHRGGLAVAVLCVDLDGFKRANDELGTEGGDELLRLVGRRLGSSIRETDILSRRAGDEFLILLADLERHEVGDLQTPRLYAESVAGRIRDAFDRPFDVGGTEVLVTVSVGISIHPDDAENFDDLLVHSGHAMRVSKQVSPGGFSAFGSEAMGPTASFAFVTKLRKATERKEWHLAYQPIVELATGAIRGVEALIRWTTGDGETIPPNEFIPLAEELGLIERIGDWVVEELVRQDQTWRAEGLNIELGFNLSPRQFWQPDLAERILAKLKEGGTDPRHIVIEITETSAMRDPDRANELLWDLHEHGLRLALDDFGTGYSSLSRLRNLPVDVLKIDRMFVGGVDRDEQSAQIVSAFIQLGRALGMTTLAEGIETEGEWRFLAEQGCELGQGFYFSRPVPADEITERFRAGRLALASR